MLIQVHLQDRKTFESEFVEQFEIAEGESGHHRVKEILDKHGAPPEGKQWLVCNETSEYFKWMKAK